MANIRREAINFKAFPVAVKVIRKSDSKQIFAESHIAIIKYRYNIDKNPPFGSRWRLMRWKSRRENIQSSEKFFKFGLRYLFAYKHVLPEARSLFFTGFFFFSFFSAFFNLFIYLLIYLFICLLICLLFIYLFSYFFTFLIASLQFGDFPNLMGLFLCVAVTITRCFSLESTINLYGSQPPTNDAGCNITRY